MNTHLFFQSHATHYNTISNGVKPPVKIIKKYKPRRGDRAFCFWN
ncbi:MAG: hypothetical protein HW390_1492 [Candidatus Brocadiaceae bacterium]|nr:hypothetical protein [Candidatus Brocadiaceae bacterium]